MRYFLLLLLLCLLLPASGLPSVAAATTRIVTDCGDSGTGTLRDLLARAGNGDTITWGKACSTTFGSEITLTTDVTIDGGGHTVVLDGAGSVGLFFVPHGFTAGFRQLTLQHGKATLNCPLTPAFQCGGAILSGGILTVTDCTFSGNTSDYGYGGGIYNRGTLTVTGSTFSGNSAVVGGGAIDSSGTLTVGTSTFSSNTTRKAEARSTTTVTR